MPEIDATPSQRAAIESRGSAVLVSAGAGSGKTRVLTERLLRYIEDGKDIDGFLVITFTRAAAAELRGRIMTMLAEKAAKDPSNRHLRRQSALCRRASIQTIDGFCSELLRQNCHLLGLAPDFRIIEDDRAAQMKAAALDRTMEECYAHPEAHPGFLALADTVGDMVQMVLQVWQPLVDIVAVRRLQMVHHQQAVDGSHLLVVRPVVVESIDIAHRQEEILVHLAIATHLLDALVAKAQRNAETGQHKYKVIVGRNHVGHLHPSREYTSFAHKINVLHILTHLGLIRQK